ncbi:MAG: hypothetical protein J5720_07395 [Bacteroidaceae bacterium]|nr:hypothetical protein [Bacteroidaceae bacterium]
MAKKFLYLAMVAFAATAFVACGSDDDDGGNNNNNNGKEPVTIKPAKMADVAGKYKLQEPLKSDNSAFELKSVEIMDGGQVSFEMYNPSTSKVEVIVADVEMKGNTGTIKQNNRVQGTFTLEPISGTKAIESNHITLNITINGEPYITEEGSPAECVLEAVLDSQGGVLDYVAQKFQVTGMIINLKGDVKAFKEFASANLYEIAQIAQDNGANLTKDELDSFKKVISFVSVSRYGTIDIVYSDGKCDSGSWNWLNNQADKMNLWLKDKGMGNKFIPENTTIDLDFSGNQCAMKLHAEIKGSKNYTADLTLVMTAVQ